MKWAQIPAGELNKAKAFFDTLSPGGGAAVSIFIFRARIIELKARDNVGWRQDLDLRAGIMRKGESLQGTAHFEKVLDRSQNRRPALRRAIRSLSPARSTVLVNW